MSAANLLQLLVERGFRLTVDGATLRVAPAAKLDADLQHEIVTHKADLLAMLSPQGLTADEQADIKESIEERAAIREHDGGEDRATAEAQATSAMRVYRLLIAKNEGIEPRWVTMLAPGCDLAEAERTARLKFPGRVKAVVPNATAKPATDPPGASLGLAVPQIPLSSTTPQNASETA